MSLKNLTLTTAAPAPAADATHRGREKLISYLGDQKSLAAAEAEGGTFAPTRMVRRKNDAGEMVRADVPRHVRRGWFRGADGCFYFQLRYGSKPLALGKDVNAVAVGELTKLPEIVDALVGAVNAGELDEQIAAAAADRRASFATRKKKPAQKG